MCVCCTMSMILIIIIIMCTSVLLITVSLLAPNTWLKNKFMYLLFEFIFSTTHVPGFKLF